MHQVFNINKKAKILSNPNLQIQILCLDRLATRTVGL